jgi:hypothetical protein
VWPSQRKSSCKANLADEHWEFEGRGRGRHVSSSWQSRTDFLDSCTSADLLPCSVVRKWADSGLAPAFVNCALFVWLLSHQPAVLLIIAYLRGLILVTLLTPHWDESLGDDITRWHHLKEACIEDTWGTTRVRNVWVHCLWTYIDISSQGHDSIAWSSYCYIHSFRDVRSHLEWNSILLEWSTAPERVTKGLHKINLKQC